MIRNKSQLLFVCTPEFHELEVVHYWMLYPNPMLSQGFLMPYVPTLIQVISCNVAAFSNFSANKVATLRGSYGKC